MNNPQINKIEKEQLSRNIKTDILVIGSGIAGVVCAYELKKHGYDVVLVDKGQVGCGVTKKTTAFLSIEQDYLYHDMINDLGYEKAKRFLNYNLEALSFYERLSKKADIGFQKTNLILYSTKNENKILNEQRALQRLGIETKIINELDLNMNVKKALVIPNQAYIDPFKTMFFLTKDLKIYQNTKIIKLTSNYAYTESNTIKFKIVIVATNYPFLRFKGLHFLKLSQKMSSVISIKYNQLTNMYLSIDEDGLYIRPYDDYTIIGGFDRNLKNEDQNNLQSLENTVLDIFPNVEIINKWINQDVVTLDKVPHIGRFDMLHQNWYLVTGFNLWGFLWSYAASQIIIKQIKSNQKSYLTNPQRFFLNKAFVKHTFNTFKSVFKFKKPRCTHLGSSLNYNTESGCWECPSHGSRFKKDGTVVNGPAQKDLKF